MATDESPETGAKPPAEPETLPAPPLRASGEELRNTRIMATVTAVFSVMGLPVIYYAAVSDANQEVRASVMALGGILLFGFGLTTLAVLAVARTDSMKLARHNYIADVVRKQGLTPVPLGTYTLGKYLIARDAEGNDLRVMPLIDPSTGELELVQLVRMGDRVRYYWPGLPL
jgi:hypothetical protein